MRFKSFHPPFSYEGVFSNQKYVICSSDGDGWVKVNRHYSWEELKPLWDKIEYGKTNVVTKTKRKEYKVKGSKNNVYKVVSDDGIWTCSCPAHGFGRGRDCKHITQIKSGKNIK
jgi:hypothetical protein